MSAFFNPGARFRRMNLQWGVRHDFAGPSEPMKNPRPSMRAMRQDDQIRVRVSQLDRPSSNTSWNWHADRVDRYELV